MFNFKKKVLFGLSVSLVLAMAIGSFAINDAQTPVIPQVSSNDDSAFTVEGGTKDQDYHFTTYTDQSGHTKTKLSIHPQNVDTEITIKNTNPAEETTDYIEVTSAAKITLAGVNINSDTPLKIEDNATFNVNITLATGSENILKSDSNDAALQKSGGIENIGTLTIGGTGSLTAIGGMLSAGIGSNVFNGYCKNIKITGGNITAIGGEGAAGIGGGWGNNAENIEITGGIVKAFGGFMINNNIKNPGAGIGGGARTDDDSPGKASGNKISGNAVVFAASGGKYDDGTEKEALQGFDEDSQGSINNCITFTGVGEYEYNMWNNQYILKDVDYNDGKVYGDATLLDNLEIPITLTVPEKQSLKVNQGVTLTVPSEMELKNEGTLTINGDVDLSKGGKITTLVNYDTQGGTIANYNEYKTYKDSSSSDVKTYETLPVATKDGYYFGGWYTEKEGKGTKVEESINVLLNVHMLYANWVEPTPPTPPTPTPPGPEPTPTPPEPGPGPTPEPTPDPSVNPDGDGSGSDASSKTSDPFMGGIALALLGVATTGAVLVRKRK